MSASSYLLLDSASRTVDPGPKWLLFGAHPAPPLLVPNMVNIYIGILVNTCIYISKNVDSVCKNKNRERTKNKTNDAKKGLR
jgi:hypothetical protein